MKSKTVAEGPAPRFYGILCGKYVCMLVGTSC